MAVPTSYRVLCEDTLLPVIAGERPFMLDPFMFRVASRRKPALAADLARRLERREFRAVVLMVDLRAAWGREYVEAVDFGPGFAEALSRGYRLVGTRGPYFIHRPRPGPR